MDEGFSGLTPSFYLSYSTAVSRIIALFPSEDSRLNQSLTIAQEIGDLAGLCATLFSIGHIHWQPDQQEVSIKNWLSVYKIAKQVDLAEALKALAGLADEIGLTDGLEGWSKMASTED